MEGKACKTNRHCVDWGFCHRCQPKLSEKVQTAWAALEVPDGQEDWMYEKLIREVKAKNG